MSRQDKEALAFMLGWFAAIIAAIVWLVIIFPPVR